MATLDQDQYDRQQAFLQIATEINKRVQDVIAQAGPDWANNPEAVKQVEALQGQRGQIRDALGVQGNGIRAGNPLNTGTFADGRGVWSVFAERDGFGNITNTRSDIGANPHYQAPKTSFGWDDVGNLGLQVGSVALGAATGGPVGAALAANQLTPGGQKLNELLGNSDIAKVGMGALTGGVTGAATAAIKTNDDIKKLLDSSGFAIGAALLDGGLLGGLTQGVNELAKKYVPNFNELQNISNAYFDEENGGVVSAAKQGLMEVVKDRVPNGDQIAAALSAGDMSGLARAGLGQLAKDQIPGAGAYLEDALKGDFAGMAKTGLGDIARNQVPDAAQPYLQAALNQAQPQAQASQPPQSNLVGEPMATKSPWDYVSGAVGKAANPDTISKALGANMPWNQGSVYQPGVLGNDPGFQIPNLDLGNLGSMGNWSPTGSMPQLPNIGDVNWSPSMGIPSGWQVPNIDFSNPLGGIQNIFGGSNPSPSYGVPQPPAPSIMDNIKSGLGSVGGALGSIPGKLGAGVNAVSQYLGGQGGAPGRTNAQDLALLAGLGFTGAGLATGNDKIQLADIYNPAQGQTNTEINQISDLEKALRGDAESKYLAQRTQGRQSIEDILGRGTDEALGRMIQGRQEQLNRQGLLGGPSGALNEAVAQEAGKIRREQLPSLLNYENQSQSDLTASRNRGLEGELGLREAGLQRNFGLGDTQRQASLYERLLDAENKKAQKQSYLNLGSQALGYGFGGGTGGKSPGLSSGVGAAAPVAFETLLKR